MLDDSISYNCIVLPSDQVSAISHVSSVLQMHKVTLNSTGELCVAGIIPSYKRLNYVTWTVILNLIPPFICTPYTLI